MSLEGIEEAIISAYAKKYNVSEEQAKQILAPILAKKDKLEDLKEIFDEFKKVLF